MELHVAQPHYAYMLLEMAVAAIRTSRLTKDYGSGHGLFDLDLQVSPQEVFGYLGPNGAGKTTTIRLLMGMIRPTSGGAYVFGLDCVRDSVEVTGRVGYLPGDLPQFGSLRGSELVASLGGRRGRAHPPIGPSSGAPYDLATTLPFAGAPSANRRK